MMNQNYQPIYEPPRNAPPPAGSLSWPKILFFAHLALYIFVAFVTMAYIYHSYRQGIAPVEYRIRFGDGSGRGFYGGVQQVRPSYGPFFLLLFGWGVGLIIHFLSVFVLAGRRFTGFSGLTGPAYHRPSAYTYYQPNQSPYVIAPPDPFRAEQYRYERSEHFPYAWPPPPQPGQSPYEANPRKDYEQ